MSTTLLNSEKRKVYDLPLLPHEANLLFLTSSETYCLLQLRAFIIVSVVISKFSAYMVTIVAHNLVIVKSFNSAYDLIDK